ncbi:hypothetical protein [Nocardia sp. NRRL S-836]|uniref:hypothetical protein n=1 Tax=Nocardia sp. NRRL S-836 TaxID=1519492 RepID=UPI0006AE9323|nr:hypothetical protein [Nocardia sp. NRRL S-836]KOV82059.1 hypothetical protein ADL03_26300 [Nocardia sp. NRRL S-836]
MRIPLDTSVHRERAFTASRGLPVAYPFSLAEALDLSEQALRRVVAIGWLRTLERLPRLAEK